MIDQGDWISAHKAVEMMACFPCAGIKQAKQALYQAVVDGRIRYAYQGLALPTSGADPLHEEIRAGKQFGPDPHDLPCDIGVNIDDMNAVFYDPAETASLLERRKALLAELPVQKAVEAAPADPSGTPPVVVALRPKTGAKHTR
jgi:hypothetical protein